MVSAVGMFCIVIVHNDWTSNRATAAERLLSGLLVYLQIFMLF
jgi:hypothetical protein